MSDDQAQTSDACKGVGTIRDMAIQEQLAAALDLHEDGRLEEAELAYRALLEICPDRSDLLNNLGSVLTQLDRPAEGLQAFDQVLEVKPLDAAAHANRGHALAGLSREPEALAAYEEALRLQPDFAEAHLNRARTLHRLSRDEEALAALQETIRFAPDNTEAHYLTALLLGRRHCFEAGLAAVDRALALAPDDTQALHLRANLLRAARRYEDAIAVFRQALALQPGSLAIQGDMGVALREQGDTERSAQCFVHVLDAMPRSPIARRQLRLTYEAHAAAIHRGRSSDGPKSDSSGHLIIGIGTGRCGSTSLVQILRAQSADVAVTHERPPGLPWQQDAEDLAFHVDCFRTLLKAHRYVGDVAHWWLRYLGSIFDTFPAARVVALQRDRQETIESFERLRGHGPESLNHWCEHDGSYWRRSLWDDYYPSYALDDRAAAIGRYWDTYYQEVETWVRRRPEHVKLVPVTDLNDPVRLRALLAFLGFENPVVPGRTAWNVGTSQEGAGLKDLPRTRG